MYRLIYSEEARKDSFLPAIEDTLQKINCCQASSSQFLSRFLKQLKKMEEENKKEEAPYINIINLEGLHGSLQILVSCFHG